MWKKLGWRKKLEKSNSRKVFSCYDEKQNNESSTNLRYFGIPILPKKIFGIWIRCEYAEIKQKVLYFVSKQLLWSWVHFSESQIHIRVTAKTCHLILSLLSTLCFLFKVEFIAVRLTWSLVCCKFWTNFNFTTSF